MRRRRKRYVRPCSVCGLTVISTRRDARFCGASCRQRARRILAMTERQWERSRVKQVHEKAFPLYTKDNIRQQKADQMLEKD